MSGVFTSLTLRFSPFGSMIVAAQLLPNIIWALFPPATNRLKGNASSVAFLEYGEHVLGVTIVILLLFLGNKIVPTEVFGSRWALTAYGAIALYFACWVLYFSNIQIDMVIYAMVVLPPIAFFAAGAAERVWPICAASAVFMAFHLLVTMENFPLVGR